MKLRKGGKKMYPNLEAELARNNIKKKELAKTWDCRLATVYDKLNGKSSITLDEAIIIQKEHFPEFSVEYLFEKRNKGA
jgi:hypothetical protein